MVIGATTWIVWADLWGLWNSIFVSLNNNPALTKIMMNARATSFKLFKYIGECVSSALYNIETKPEPKIATSTACVTYGINLGWSNFSLIAIFLHSKVEYQIGLHHVLRALNNSICLYISFDIICLWSNFLTIFFVDI